MSAHDISNHPKALRIIAAAAKAFAEPAGAKERAVLVKTDAHYKHRKGQIANESAVGNPVDHPDRKQT